VSSRRPHEPEQLTVLVTRQPGGGFVLRCPMCPGWAVPARTPAELAQMMERAWQEAAIAAYARLRGVLYDLAETEECIPPSAYPAVPTAHPGENADEVAARRRRRQRHPATHDPERWMELEDGSLLSPAGRRYGPETRVASAVRRARTR
jgi:predicted RNase H-like HicB family nuclease